MISTVYFSKNLNNRSTRSARAKRFFMGFLMGTWAIAAHSQPLFTYGKYPVSTQQFLAAFNKNPPAGNRAKAMQEYLPLFINYKLKVQYAYDNRMDTLVQQQEDLFQYRQQLQDHFLQQQYHTEKLVDEAVERSQYDMLLGHIYIPFDKNDSSSVLAARRKINEAHQQLKKGVAFGKVANSFNEGSQPANGVAGWVTVFSLPYRFETAVYLTPTGGFTAPLQGADGYHLFSPLQKRAAWGTIKVAQILLWLPQDATPQQIAAKQHLADSLYQALQQGADFAQLAQRYSDDRTSYASGGLLPELGVGQYDPTFEAAAFGLNPSKRYSQPFRTSYGLHLLKFVEKQSDSLFRDKETWRQKLIASERATMARERFLKTLPAKLGFKKNNAIRLTDLWAYSDSALNNRSAPGNPIQKQTFLFSVGTEKVLAENWVLYLRGVPVAARKNYPALWSDYQQQTAEWYYKENLEQLEPAFASQVKEFQDANLLFQAMETKVWSAAAADTAGQLSYYVAHKDRYRWADGAQVLSVASPDSAIGAAFKNQLLLNPGQWRAIAAAFNESVIVDSARLEISQLPVERFENGVQAGAASQLYKNELDGSVSFSLVLSKQSGGDFRTFQEARGWVITDFQNLLENQWLEQLKTKYPVKLNEVVWQQLLKVN